MKTPNFIKGKRAVVKSSALALATKYLRRRGRLALAAIPRAGPGNFFRPLRGLVTPALTRSRARPTAGAGTHGWRARIHRARGRAGRSGPHLAPPPPSP